MCTLYRDFGEIRKNRCWKLLRPRESVGTTLRTLLTCCGTLRRLRRPREPFPMPLELLDVFGVTSGEPPWIGSQYDKNPWIFMDFPEFRRHFSKIFDPTFVWRRIFPIGQNINDRLAMRMRSFLEPFPVRATEGEVFLKFRISPKSLYSVHYSDLSQKWLPILKCFFNYVPKPCAKIGVGPRHQKNFSLSCSDRKGL